MGKDLVWVAEKNLKVALDQAEGFPVGDMRRIQVMRSLGKLWN